MIIRLAALALLASVAPIAAKPLVTSSEETVARICLARQETPERIVQACDVALAEAGSTAAQRVELMVARGDAFAWQDNHTEAADSYRAASELDPQSSDAWNGLGWALWEIESEAAAYEAFSKSLEAGVTVQGLGGKAATARRTGLIGNDEARDMLRAALAIDPDYIWAVREVAWSFLEDRNHAAAIEEFEAALEIEPGDSNAQYGLGRARMSAGDNAEALGLFNEVLVSSPEDFSAKVYRIIALRNLDRNAQALRDSDRLILAHPDRASGYIERGLSLMALERRIEAIETYRTAEDVIGPNNAILYWYADALTYDGRFGEALEVIERGLVLEGADYSDHLMKSYIALELKDYAMARDAARASLATGVEDPWAHYYLAITLVHGGDTLAGIDRFQRAIENGLPEDRVSAFAKELISAGKYVEAAQLRLKY